MALASFGGKILQMSGKFAGNVFQRDMSGNHIKSMQRRVKKRTPAQLTQRRAFIKARSFSRDNRIVSYNIYRALNNLPLQMPPPDYSPPNL